MSGHSGRPNRALLPRLAAGRGLLVALLALATSSVHSGPCGRLASPETGAYHPPELPQPPGPLACNCFSAKGDNIAHCDDPALVTVPLFGNVTAVNLLTLTIRKTALAVVPPRAFAGLTRLRTLSLKENELESIHVNALYGLTTLKRIVLGMNPQLLRLPPGLFVHTPNLEYLDIVDGALRMLEPGIFRGLAKVHTLLMRPQLDLRARTLPIQTIHGGAEVFRDLPALEVLDAPNQYNLLTGQVDWAVAAAYMPALRKILLPIPSYLVIGLPEDTPLPINQLRHVRNLQELDVSGILFRNLTRADFIGMDRLQNVTLSLGTTCGLNLIERDTFSVLPALRSVVMGPPLPDQCDPIPSRCFTDDSASGLSSLTCLCADNFFGDGTFCEPGCPPVASFVDPRTGLAREHNCSLAGHYQDAVCCTDSVAQPPLYNADTCATTALLCDRGVWQPLPRACGSLGICECLPNLRRIFCPPSSYLPLAPSTVVILRAKDGIQRIALTSKFSYPVLVLLDLERNRLTAPPGPSELMGVPAIEQLVLENPKDLQQLSPNAMAHLPALNDVRLSGFRPKVLFLHSFPPRISRLYIRSNTLEELEDGIFDDTPLLQKLRMDEESNTLLFSPAVEITHFRVQTLAAIPALDELTLKGREALLARWERDEDLPRALGPLRTSLRTLTLSFSQPADVNLFPLLLPNLTTLRINEVQELTLGMLHGLGHLEELSFEFTPQLTRIEQGVFNQSLLPRLRSVGQVFFAQGQSNCSMSPGKPLACSCAAGFAGDGTFCEPLCGPPPTDFVCNHTVNWHGRRCYRAQPLSMVICNRGVWETVVSACEQCTCSIKGSVRCPDMGLTAVPVDFPQNTTALTFDNNNFTTVRSNSLDGLSRLSTLRLIKCRLVSVKAADFVDLRSLEHLDLAENTFTSLPAALPLMLPKLRMLRLAMNSLLAEIPLAALGAMPQLADLDLAHTPGLAPQLASAPYIPGLFPALEQLDLSSTNLEMIPEWVRRMPRLVSLRFEGNPITSIPPNMLDGLKNLTRLSIQSTYTQRRLNLLPNIFSSIFTNATSFSFSLFSPSFLCFNVTNSAAGYTCHCNSDHDEPTVQDDSGTACMVPCPELSTRDADGQLISCASGLEGDYCQLPCGAPASALELSAQSSAAIFMCTNGQWMTQSIACLSLTAFPTTAPTVAPTPNPTVANSTAGGNSSGARGGGGGGGGLAVAGPIVAVSVVLAALLVLVVLVRRRRRSSSGHGHNAVMEMQLRSLVAERVSSIFAREFGRCIWDKTHLNQGFAQLEMPRDQLRLIREIERGEAASQWLAMLGTSGRRRGRGGGGVATLLSSGRMGSHFGNTHNNSSSSNAAPANGLEVVVHQPQDTQMDRQNQIVLEARILHLLQHPNVLRLLGVVTETLPVAYITEFLAGGDLRTYLRGCRPSAVRMRTALADTDFLIMAGQVCAAMVYLESKSIVHRNLRSTSIRVGRGPADLRLADFSQCRDVYQTDVYVSSATTAATLAGLNTHGDAGGAAPHSSCGNSSSAASALAQIRWLSPEAALDGVFSHRSDSWAFAVLLWEMTSFGRTPYGACEAREILEEIQGGHRLQQPTACSDDMYSLMQQCWAASAEARPGFVDIDHQLRRQARRAGVAVAQSALCDTTTIGQIGSGESDAFGLPGTNSGSQLSSSWEISPAALEFVQSVSASRRSHVKRFAWHRHRAAGGEAAVRNGDLLAQPESLGSAAPAPGAASSPEMQDARRDATLDVAVRTLAPGLSSDHKAMEVFAGEVRLLQTISHPNIVGLLGLCSQTVPPMAVLEWMDHGPLDEFLAAASGARQSDMALAHLALDVAQGLEFLAGRHIVHRNLCAHKCLVKALNQGGSAAISRQDGGGGGRFLAKISGFSLSRQIDEQEYYRMQAAQKTRVRWQSPESITNLSFSIESDVYAFGCTLFEIFAGRRQVPHAEHTDEQLLTLLRACKPLPALDGELQAVRGRAGQAPVHGDIAALLSSCTLLDASKRPSAEELVSILLDHVHGCDRWEYPGHLLMPLRVLGQGQFGTVTQMVAPDLLGPGTSAVVAVKMLHDGAPASARQDFLREMQLMKRLRHPHIVSLLGVCTKDDQPLRLILEYLQGGALDDWLQERVAAKHGLAVGSNAGLDAGLGTPQPNLEAVSLPSAEDLLYILHQMALGMAALGRAGIVHRDLAARNVLVGERLHVKISDYGLSRDIENNEYYRLQTGGSLPIRWMAPEVLREGKHSVKSDVWSFAVTVWEMYTFGDLPFEKLDNDQLLAALRTNSLPDLEFPPTVCAAAIAELMGRCMHRNPDLRPTFAQLIELTRPESWAHLLRNARAGVATTSAASAGQGWSVMQQAWTHQPTRRPSLHLQPIPGQVSHHLDEDAVV